MRIQREDGLIPADPKRNSFPSRILMEESHLNMTPKLTLLPEICLVQRHFPRHQDIRLVWFEWSLSETIGACLLYSLSERTETLPKTEVMTDVIN